MTMRISRRLFIKGTGSALALSLCQLSLKAGSATASDPVQSVDYHGFEDIYREKWTWDRVAKGSHHVNCWYQRCCNWNIYVKDGIVWREEQAGTYPQTNAEVPDYNPRGCQKGACYSSRMYDASRLRYPLKRIGKRGEGKWKRISRQQALREIADRTIDVLSEDGAGAVIWDEGSAGSNIGVQRTGVVLDTPVLDIDSEFGDHHPGAAVTCGKVAFSSSADDLFYSDLILIWGGNPVYTQIPNAHFINEARYNGARVVTIAPDYSASAIHADQWIPLNVGSDAALGLAMAQVMIEEGIYDRQFVTEQTDLPLLIRSDTRHFLRESDLERRGADDIFYLYDRNKKAIVRASQDSLALDGLEPALEGEFHVTTLSGEVTVRPVFALLRQHLAQYTPEQARKSTGTHPDTVREFARALAGAKAATCITQSNFGKFYHGMEMERAQFLVFALAGQMGKKGSGINGFPNIWLSGHEGLIAGDGSLPPKYSLLPMGLKLAPDVLMMKLKGYTPDIINHELMRQKHADEGSSSVLLLYHQAGMDKHSARARDWDPHLKREFAEYMDEALEQGWQFRYQGVPRIFFQVGGNFLRRNRGYPGILTELWPKLDLVVTLDSRMSFTAMHSDYVLPAAGYYEQDTIPWTTPITPFVQITTRAVEPLGESMSDWEFHCLFMKALEQRAKERGIKNYKDRHGKERALDNVYQEFTFQERFTETNEKDLWAEALSLADNVGELSWDELEEKGFHRYTDMGSGFTGLGNATDIVENETITANSWHTENKHPWPTLTRRMQFYIDHKFYLELGEELPVHKDSPPIGGNYPLHMSSGHTRWSIHATWRDQVDLLRLQRGGPVVFIGHRDAAARAIEDGDTVRVFNDMDSFEVQAKVSAAVRPGQVIVYHAWEPYQFKEHKSPHAVTPSPINPIQLAGGQLHLQPRLMVGTPGPSDRDTRVDVERVSRGQAPQKKESL